MASGHPGDVGYSSTPRVAWGVVIMLLSVIVPVGAVILTAISEGVDAHHRWVSQHPREQQERIRQAERAAAWGAAAAGAVALHEHNKRRSAELAASVIGTGSGPGRAGAAAFATQQRRQADQRHQELLDAIRVGGQRAADPLDARPLLARSQQSPASQRRRTELGW
jgi:hypothetical protein